MSRNVHLDKLQGICKITKKKKSFLVSYSIIYLENYFNPLKNLKIFFLFRIKICFLCLLNIITSTLLRTFLTCSRTVIHAIVLYIFVHLNLLLTTHRNLKQTNSRSRRGIGGVKSTRSYNKESMFITGGNVETSVQSVLSRSGQRATTVYRHAMITYGFNDENSPRVSVIMRAVYEYHQAKLKLNIYGSIKDRSRMRD